MTSDTLHIVKENFYQSVTLDRKSGLELENQDTKIIILHYENYHNLCCQILRIFYSEILSSDENI